MKVNSRFFRFVRRQLMLVAAIDGLRGPTDSIAVAHLQIPSRSLFSHFLNVHRLIPLIYIFFFWFVYLPWKLIVINQVCSSEVAAVCVCLQKNESYSRISYRTRDKLCDEWEKWMQIKDIDSIQLLRLWYRLQASHYQIRHSYLSHSRIPFLYIF